MLKIIIAWQNFSMYQYSLVPRFRPIRVQYYIQSTLHHIVPVEEQCLTGDVRLVNGSKTAGRLEVCFNGVWGTVCRFGWTVQATTVVCKQLGFNSGVVLITTHSHTYTYIHF